MTEALVHIENFRMMFGNTTVIEDLQMGLAKRSFQVA